GSGATPEPAPDLVLFPRLGHVSAGGEPILFDTASSGVGLSRSRVASVSNQCRPDTTRADRCGPCERGRQRSHRAAVQKKGSLYVFEAAKMAAAWRDVHCVTCDNCDNIQ